MGFTTQWGLQRLSIRLQTLDSGWETVGADRLRGVVAEHFQASSNSWGSDRCSFQLRRDPGAVQPDLSAFTPCRVFVGGIRVWSGRVKETPSQDGADQTISVAGEGWQYHLDDDVYDRIYIHSRISEWVDARTLPTIDLAAFVTNAQVTTGGFAVISLPIGTIVNTNDAAGVVFDLGPTNTIKELSLDSRFFPTTAPGWNFLVRAANTPDIIASGGLTSTGLTRAYTANTFFSDIVSFGAFYRYIACFLVRTGVNVTTTADVGITLSRALIATDAAYTTGGNSVLKADVIVKDAVVHATAKLSADISEIKAGTFVIPEFALSGAQSPREVISAVNAYENYETKVDVWDRLCFRPRVTDPIYEIGEWSGADLADTSTNSGDEIYNRVIVQATGPDGQPTNVSRSAGGLVLSAPVYEALASSFIPNPSFTTNTTGWTAAVGAITRTTTAGEFESAPAGGKFTGGAIVASCALSGTFQAGTTYVLSFRVMAPTLIYQFFVELGDDANNDSNTVAVTNSGGGGFVSSPNFTTFSVSWSPQIDRTTVAATFSAFMNGLSVFIDSLTLARAVPTLVDRRGFTRTKILPVSSGITTDVGNQIGDLYLKSHRTVPFRGSFQVVGQNGVRRVLGGDTVHPAWLLTETGQLVRCSDRVDPDTGGWGRTGKIASVNYDHDTLTSSVSLDDDRGGFETLLSRYSLIVGQGPKP